MEDSTKLELFSVCFADELNGWVVGGDSENGAVVLHTDDGGETWNPQYADLTLTLNCVRFTDANHGWAGGERFGRGVILFTTDGGATWQTDPFSLPHAPEALAFVDQNAGWVVGQTGTIAHFTGTSDVPPDRPPRIVPREIALSAYPNPFNPVTRLEAVIPLAGRAQLAVYDVTGRLVGVLWDGHIASGPHTFTFDGSKLPSGVYFAHLRGVGSATAARLIIVK